MSVVLPNTGAPGEPRPASRRVGPLGAQPRRRSGTGVRPNVHDGRYPDPANYGSVGHEAGHDNGNGDLRDGYGYPAGNGNAAGNGNGSGNGYLPGNGYGDWVDTGNGSARGNGAHGRANGAGYDRRAVAAPENYAPGSPAALNGRGPAADHRVPQDPVVRHPRSSGAPPEQAVPPRGAFGGAPDVPISGRLPVQDRQPYRPDPGMAGAPVRPTAGRRIGGSTVQRPIRPIHASIDAPTEIVRRNDARSYSPGLPRQGALPVRDRPVRVLPREARRSRVVDPGPDTQFDVAGPSSLDRLDRPTGAPARGGRRHHRAGSRPASDFTVGAPTRGVKRGRRRRGTFWRELPMLMVVALVLTFLIQTFLARVYEIPSGSMETTLHGCTGCTNDRVLVDKLSYHFGDPSPGDVIVFAGPPSWQDENFGTKKAGNIFVRAFQSVGSLVGLASPDEKDLIKRVIAVGGQTVECCDAQNRVTVDGKALNEPYIYYLPEAGPPSQQEFGPVKIPAGQLWAMGDSRNNSADSRVPGHGPIPLTNVIGKARFVVLPVSRAQPIHAINGQLGSTAPAAR